MDEDAARIRTWVLRIEDWTPTLDNQLYGHWGTKARRKRQDAEMVKGYALSLRIPRATGKRRVLIRLSGWGRGGNLPDPTAPLKSLLDALVTAGLLLDDGQRWCELAGPPVIERAKRRETVVVLTDL